MELIIVTGMSGAGKTQAVEVMEDLGYYCVDNIPPRLITKFAELPTQSGERISRIALVVDVRSQQLFFEYTNCLDELHERRLPYKTLFLDCESAVLLRRYKETRRRHPLQDDASPTIEGAVARERKLLAEAKERADFVVDTSRFSARQLKERVRELFGGAGRPLMMVECGSFGFKYGLPHDSDLVFDVRFLPNPYYELELRPLTGLDDAVRDFVLSGKECKSFTKRLFGFIDYLVPLYAAEGKSQLVVSIGCTGGQHRSVALCEHLAAHLNAAGIAARAAHRDIC